MEFLLLRGKRPSSRKVPLAARSDGCFCWLIWHCLEQAISELMHTHLWGRLFALLGNSLAKLFGKIVSTRVKNLSNTSLVASRHIKRKKASKLTYLAQKRLCLGSLLWYVYVNLSCLFLNIVPTLNAFEASSGFLSPNIGRTVRICPISLLQISEISGEQCDW